jgi:Ser/Thr protein kinase RdoA (MazF antagonist)
VDRVYRVADAVVAPVLPLLPRSTIHGDLNTWNILVNEDRNNSGAKLIDFGDMIWSITIADPGLFFFVVIYFCCEVFVSAILMAYCLLDASVGLSVICSSICSGYSSSRPLSSTEREVLFPLAALRLCTSAVITASQTVAQPNNQHLLVYQVCSYLW